MASTADEMMQRYDEASEAAKTVLVIALMTTGEAQCGMWQAVLTAYTVRKAAWQAFYAAELAEADRQAKVRDAAPLYRSNAGFSLFKAG